MITRDEYSESKDEEVDDDDDDGGGGHGEDKVDEAGNNNGGEDEDEDENSKCSGGGIGDILERETQAAGMKSIYDRTKKSTNTPVNSKRQRMITRGGAATGGK